MDSGVPQPRPATGPAGTAGRIPLAVVVVDGDGLVSHWSTGARRLFGHAEQAALGRPAADLLPVSGALEENRPYADDSPGHALDTSLDASRGGFASYPAAGRARLSEPGQERTDVLWWAYPLVGPGPERLLVLAADAARFGGDAAGPERFERIAPGFALHTDYPGSDELARRLPGILSAMSVRQSARIVSQVLELGYPVLEFSHHDRVPITPDWGVPRRAERSPRARGDGKAHRAGSVAELLQSSFLPRLPPRMAGCDTVTRYLPGTPLGRARGHWYDSVALPGSRTALVVGDVMGHGLDAAAIMGQLRAAVQTMARLDLSPAQLLRTLDDLAQRLGEHHLATCLYVIYDPVAGELLMANAGHVPPVIVRAEDGRGDLLDLPTGVPIGVGGVPFQTVRVPVAPGDRLVMCTDGLVEVRGEDIGVGLAALCESAAHPAASMDDACDAVIRALGARGGRRDDVALLMARLGGVAAEDVARWEPVPEPREVGRARRP
ncbi:PP2C family protein-serine/threonine phosphatase [Streptomyces sp. CB03234]|uniref:PP2C family protein-serine/threonine phosphatase n=1 Tax=Streptomyces sp. (strain CB03234) TaxID=1703937 RepID=UPI0009A14435